MRIKKASLALLLVSGLPVGAHAQGTNESIVVMPNDIVWKPAPVSPGPEIAVLYGDPSKPGVYVQHVRFPAGLKLMPHFSPRRMAHRCSFVRQLLFRSRRAMG